MVRTGRINVCRGSSREVSFDCHSIWKVFPGFASFRSRRGYVMYFDYLTVTVGLTGVVWFNYFITERFCCFRKSRNDFVLMKFSIVHARRIFI